MNIAKKIAQNNVKYKTKNNSPQKMRIMNE